MKPKFIVLSIIFLLSTIPSRSQVDPIWQAYYDSTYATWDIDWKKTEQLLLDAKMYIEESYVNYNEDSIYNLTINDLGIVYEKIGDYEKASKLYKIALDNLEKINGRVHPSYATTQNNLAFIYYEIGNYSNAQSIFKESLEITEKTLGKEHPDYGQRLNNLGLVHIRMGNYLEAFTCYFEAIEIYEKSIGKNNESYATTLNNLAILYFKLGRYKESEPLYQEVVDITGSITGEETAIYALRLNNLAGVYREIGDYEKALNLYRKCALIIKNSVGEFHTYYCGALNNIGIVYSRMGLYENALPPLMESVEKYKAIFGSKHPDYANSLNDLAVNFNNMGLYSKSIDLHMEALEVLRASLGDKHLDYGKCLNNLAAVYTKMDCFKEAKELYVKANNNLRSQIDQVFGVSNESNKQNFLETLHSSFQLYHSFAFFSQYQFDTLSMMLYDNEILHKGLVLNSTKETNRTIKSSEDEALLVLFENWQELKEDLAHQYSLPIAKRMSYLDSLEQVADFWEEELVRKSSAFELIRKQVKWQDVRDNLNPLEAAIEFVHFNYMDKKATDSIIYAAMLLTSSSNTPTIIPLFEERQLKELLKSDNKSNEFIYISNLYDYNENGSLYGLIWSKLERYLEGIETIYFSPSGLLHQISFPAIPTPQQHYLGNKYQLVQLNSTRQLVLPSKTPQLASITLFGGIQYAYDTSGLSKEYDKPLLAINEMDGYTQTRDVTKNSAAFLAGSVEEIKRITKRLKKTTTMHLITGTDADEASFKALSGNSPKIIHIATHGFFFPNIEKSKEELNKEDGLAFKYDENPLFRSGLHFAGSNYTWKYGYNPYEKEDGILTAYEISNLDLSNTDLVVLSACETGLGDINGSEGVYGLQRAFKMAGVENLIMSLWKVPDKQTVELMELFYANWKKGYDVRSAFKQAQNAMSEKYPPYYWAAFVFVGDVIEPQQPKINSKWWWLASGGLILIVLLMWRKREWQKVA